MAEKPSELSGQTQFADEPDNEFNIRRFVVLLESGSFSAAYRALIGQSFPTLHPDPEAVARPFSADNLDGMFDHETLSRVVSRLEEGPIKERMTKTLLSL